MTPDKPKAAADKSKPADKPAETKTVAAAPKLPPLFRRVDWLAMLVAFGVIWIVYFLTLAPELTLEDSGELCTGSFYAGIPHPPGYPFWAIYSWLWTLLPFGNVAWRVEVGESMAAAMACGMVALMVSRGSSMLLEGIEDLKKLGGKWENIICLVCGATSGMLLGFGNTMWSESVAINRISLFGAPWVMAVILCLMRWMYSPKQWRYLFLGMFFFGLCATIHQTLICAAMGLEFGVAWAYPRLGRVFCAGNIGIFMAGWIADLTGATTALQTAPMIRYIFFGVGIVSIVGYVLLALYTKATLHELIMDGAFVAFAMLSAFAMSHGAFFGFLAFICLVVWIVEIFYTHKRGLEWGTSVVCLLLWVLGVSFYFYEPISGMTDPPMQWGYPRTVEGFYHALSRGQYEKVNPTDIFAQFPRFIMQLGLLKNGIVEEYNWILFFITLIPFVFFLKMQRRERSWIATLTGVYICIGVLLLILMNPNEDRASVDLHRVFFASSHGVIAILFGMGFALVCVYMATNYQRFRHWGLAGGGIAAVLGLFSLWEAVGHHYYGISGQATMGDIFPLIAKAFGTNQYGLPVFGALLLAVLPFIFLAALAIYKDRAPLAITLAVFAGMPLCSALEHWGTSEQRNHWFGYWFGHDMFTPPFKVYPEMTKDAILFGGTDPGRFCPTYMIFCESFIPHKDQPKEDQQFDRRDVYIITQNALADPTYLDYLRAQYNRSLQIDPPFFQEFLRSDSERQMNYKTNIIARMAYSTLDVPLTAFGKRVEDRRRREGVYPPKEIYIPSQDDSTKCFNDYMMDASQRYEHDVRFPKEPRQVKQGEDVHTTDGNHISVSGQVAVMAINGLLTKVIFDKNPQHEYFVEESFPLDWMYRYETPFGIIMKINHDPIDEMSQDAINKDHQFWSLYSDRLIGNWVKYETTLKEVSAFVDKVYLQHDFNGFNGNRKFIRDDQAQKAFSKLRSSIAGNYEWRFRNAKSNADQQRMYKEAEFAYKQAFAYCPYSPEAVYHYVNLLLATQRIDDALVVATTCAKLDPNNEQVEGLVNNLKELKANGGAGQIQQTLQQMEKAVNDNTNDFQAVLNLASAYEQLQQMDHAVATLDKILNSPKANPQAIVMIAQKYAAWQNLPKLETALEKLTALEPNSPEAWCDLAAMKANLGKNAESIVALRRALEENAKRLATNPKAQDLLPIVAKDPRFNPIRSTPEFQALVKPK